MNIVIIMIDTVRKDHLSLYGARGYPTACIDKFAEDSVVYRNVVSPAPWTTPVHASLFTGLYPSRHGTHGGNLTFEPDRSMPSLMRRLGKKGYRCEGISSNYLISDQFGFHRDFDRFLQAWQGVPQPWDRHHFSRPGFRSLPYVRKALALSRDLLIPSESANVMRSLINRRYVRKHHVIEDATAATIRSLRWGKEILARREASPVFLFINLMQAHDKYNPPTEIRDDLGLGGGRFDVDMWEYYAGQEDIDVDDLLLGSCLYAGEISFLDRCLGDFFGFLRRLPEWDESLVVLLSDHGELLGEHGLLGHQIGLFGEVIDVPMIIKYPRGIMGSGEDGRIRQSHDIFATILELADAGGTERSDSLSLLDSIGRDRALSQLISNRFILDEIRRYGGVIRGDLEPYARSMMAVIRDGIKYVLSEGGNQWLYDLTEDRGENINLADDPRYSETVRAYRESMVEAMNATEFVPHSVEAPVEEETVQRLKAMGYI